MEFIRKGPFRGFLTVASREDLDSANLGEYALHPIVALDTKQWGIITETGTILWSGGMLDQNYNGSTRTLTTTYIDGSTKNIVLPADNFLANADYNRDTKILTLTLVDNSTVQVNLSELVSGISTTPDISNEQDNALETRPDGLYVFAPQIYEIRP